MITPKDDQSRAEFERDVLNKRGWKICHSVTDGVHKYTYHQVQQHYETWQAARAASSDVVRELVDAANWAKTLIKFHVKPERCVERGENIKSAIKIFEELVNALARINGESNE